jgi:predicted O-methyltransferase YrrM
MRLFRSGSVAVLDNVIWIGECQDYQAMVIEIIKGKNVV